MKDFHIENSGIFPVEVDDLGMRFFLTIVNNGKDRITVEKAHKPECCWQVEPDDEDCVSMDLFGGFPTQLDPRARKNVTYVFSNLYPLDRKGVCKFHLTQGDHIPVMHKIDFDTSQQDDGSWMKELFGNGPLIYKRCNGVDENPRNNCHPYNCAKKYNGYRSFYKTEISKCVPVTKCTTRLGDDQLPTSAFDFENNRCKSLVENDLKEEEKKVVSAILDDSSLAKEFNKYVDVNPEDLVLDCKNGVQDGRFCHCNRGWRTVSVLTANGGVKMKWCSKKVPVESKQSASSRYIKIGLLVILLSGCFCLLFLVLYLWWRLFVREIVQGKPTVHNTSKANLKLEDFPFPFVSKWKIDGKCYDSIESEDSFASLHEDVETSCGFSGELMSKEKTFEHTDYVPKIVKIRDAKLQHDVVRNTSTVPPNNLKKLHLHITESDSFVLVPQEEDQAMKDSFQKSCLASTHSGKTSAVFNSDDVDAEEDSSDSTGTVVEDVDETYEEEEVNV